MSADIKLKGRIKSLAVVGTAMKSHCEVGLVFEAPDEEGQQDIKLLVSSKHSKKLESAIRSRRIVTLKLDLGDK